VKYIISYSKPLSNEGSRRSEKRLAKSSKIAKRVAAEPREVVSGQAVRSPFGLH